MAPRGGRARRPCGEPSADPIIVVENLAKRYSDFTAMDGISFCVAEGDFFGFLDPNDAGKTTTMRILATLLAPNAGRASVAGFDAAAGKAVLTITAALVASRKARR